MTPHQEPVEEEKKGWFRRRKEEAPLSDDDWINRVVRTWRVNEMPLKSVIHLVDQLHINVEVYTYMDVSFQEPIEHWLARKGATVQVTCYDDLAHLAEDMRYNRGVHTLFTPYEQDAKVIGWHRATVVNTDGTFGF